MAIFNTQGKKTPLGIYIHVPFCRSKCQYCDFYSLTDKSDRLLDGYLDAVCDHIRETGPQAPGHQVDTIYFGGGTPSFIGADGMAAILTTIRRNFDVGRTRKSLLKPIPIPYPPSCCESSAARALTG